MRRVVAVVLAGYLLAALGNKLVEGWAGSGAAVLRTAGADAPD
jgi:hypothetical protein